MKNKKIVIAAGTGFIGKGLIDYFGQDNDIVILTRQPLTDSGRISYVQWDGKTQDAWVSHLERTDILINLAGKSVNCRYTEENRKEIFSSRVASTQVLGAAIQTLKHPPALWINSSSATIYRHAEDRPMDEFTGEIADDFSVQVCKQWEGAFNQTVTPHTRKVILRIAITIGHQGGVLTPLMNLMKFGLGGYHGNGRQQMSWVHIDDVCRMVEWLYEHPEQEGVFNCAAPHPVNNRQFMRALRKAGGHLFGLPAYTWMLKIGAQVMGTETELVLKSRWVLPTRAIQAGFVFHYPELQPALQQIIRKLPRRRYHLI
ncbi:TIGR01777 family oxidoreductase [Chitinophaga rhizophila]|uniref:TIGR01777 family oxidoreductase n=1 Tax=Chitinophaga rhizophila TaxID=2866212 RepID=A0ABS7GLB4_9BACT|nr:TIGR01777 family oxidoreductase [Chitinophaga rhizophila]MBW8687950.1 TIGR01777 family oxidoreductase [Chitinophaga rhizophila]